MLLTDIKETYHASLSVSVLSLDITATPVFGEDGERVGLVIEWNNRIAEVEVENEVSDIVNAAANSDFSQHVN